MDISGVLARNSDPLPVALIRANGKRIGVAVVIGDYETDHVQAPGNACLDLLGRLANEEGLDGTLHKVAVEHAHTAIARVHMVLSAASDKDNALFLCANETVFSVCWRGLNVQVA